MKEEQRQKEKGKEGLIISIKEYGELLNLKNKALIIRETIRQNNQYYETQRNSVNIKNYYPSNVRFNGQIQRFLITQLRELETPILKGKIGYMPYLEY